MAVNATGAFLSTPAFLPGMLERKWGRVVNVASTAGPSGGKYLAAYSAAKHALVGPPVGGGGGGGHRGHGERGVPRFVDTEMTAETVAPDRGQDRPHPGGRAGGGPRLGGPDSADLGGGGGGGRGLARDRCRHAIPPMVRPWSWTGETR